MRTAAGGAVPCAENVGLFNQRSLVAVGTNLAGRHLLGADAADSTRERAAKLQLLLANDQTPVLAVDQSGCTAEQLALRNGCADSAAAIAAEVSSCSSAACSSVFGDRPGL